jgi:type II secretion system protein D
MTRPPRLLRSSRSPLGRALPWCLAALLLSQPSGPWPRRADAQEKDAKEKAKDAAKSRPAGQRVPARPANGKQAAPRAAGGEPARAKQAEARGAGEEPPAPAPAAPAGQEPQRPDAPAPGGIGAPGGQGQVPGEGERTTILPRAAEFQKLVNIEAGDIEVLDFIRFLADYTGLPVIVDSSNQQALRQTITIATRMEDVTGDIVAAILQANRFLVSRRVLPSGQEILSIEPSQAAVPAPDEPQETKILEVREGIAELIDATVTAELQNIRPDEIATMVFTLKYTQPADAITSLNSLISGAAGKQTARTKAFSIVDVKNSMMVIITAKFGLLNYLQKLLTIIDVPLKEAERIIDIIDVENADADELTQLILQFLQGRTGGATRLGARAQAVPTQPGQPGQPIATGVRGQAELQTNLISDWRTQKIIVETYSERDLEDIHMLVRELDTRYDIRRLKTRIYQVRYLKADEVAADLQQLIGGSSFGLSGRAGLGTRTGQTGGRAGGRTGGIPRVQRGPAGAGAPTPTPGVPGGQQGGQNAPIPALIVPHIQTNSLIIQAEPEEYAEVLNILSQIDVKRRQVFLEAALVEVTSQSQLNWTIELLAGEPNDESLRTLFESSFGLSGIDTENWNRTIPDLSNPASVPPGALIAVMNRGKFPALIQFFKTNTDSQVLATPFILADDNQTNVIDVIETRFVQQTNVSGPTGVTTTSNEGEDAGITLELTPTISSRSAVFLELSLEVSQFQGGGTPQVLPPKTTNTIASAVTIPDGEIFVVGGLTRENKSKSVSKVPIIGDIPIVGKLFRSETTFRSASNLYIFLRAHVLTHPDFLDGVDLTNQGLDKVHEFAPGLNPTQFDRPNVQMPAPPPADPDAPTRLYRTSRDFEEGREAPQGVYEPRARRERPVSHTPESYGTDPESPFGTPRGTAPVPRVAEHEDASSVGAVPSPPVLRDPRDEPPPPADVLSPPETEGGIEAPPPIPAPEESVSDEEARSHALEGSGFEVDPSGQSWLIPLRKRNP